jgi:hypothetical protein
MEILITNNDYNEQNPYANPGYETTEENNQVSQDYNGGYAYNNYNYQNNYNGNSGYTYMGGTVIDSNGKPLKNHFGAKLTLSILEMLCCCTSCITLIMGIIACVFTCQANSCYKEGRYEEFKSKAKTSTILLIVGGVFAALAIIINVASLASMSEDGFWDEFMYEYEKALEEELGTDVDMDTFWDDVNEGKYDNLYDESLEGDDTYSDYIEGVYHWDSDDCNHMTMS